MRGRKPKPTHLKVIEGNPGKRPLNANEPMAFGDLRDAPAWMTPSQKEGWAYAIEHAPAGLLKKIDRSVLVIWIVAEDLHRAASQKVQDFGMLTKTAKSGEAVQSPYLPVLNKQAQIMLKAAASLGFEPASRSRIDLGNSEGKANRFSGFGQRPA